jgi:hypothetical protein
MRGGWVMRTLKRQRWIAVFALLVVVGVSLAAVVVSRAATSSGCGNVDVPIVESEQFTSVTARLTQPLDPPINPSGQQAVSVPPVARVPSIDGLPLRWAVVSSNGAVYQYFLRTDLDSTLTVSEFYAAGGIQLDRDPVDNGESFAAYVLATLGERALQIQVGDHVAALVWADPQVNGLRTHHLYWSDDAYNFSLLADMSAERLVTVARQLVCGGTLGF